MARTQPTTLYTLVRHTGFTDGGNPQFEHATEERSIEPRHTAAILKAGGLVFNSYIEACDRAEMENYPPAIKGLIPSARGAFTTLHGMEIYIPASGGLVTSITVPMTRAEAWGVARLIALAMHHADADKSDKFNAGNAAKRIVEMLADTNPVTAPQPTTDDEGGFDEALWTARHSGDLSR